MSCEAGRRERRCWREKWGLRLVEVVVEVVVRDERRWKGRKGLSAALEEEVEGL